MYRTDKELPRAERHTISSEKDFYKMEEDLSRVDRRKASANYDLDQYWTDEDMPKQNLKEEIMNCL